MKETRETIRREEKKVGKVCDKDWPSPDIYHLNINLSAFSPLFPHTAYLGETYYCLQTEQQMTGDSAIAEAQVQMRGDRRGPGTEGVYVAEVQVYRI